MSRGGNMDCVIRRGKVYNVVVTVPADLVVVVGKKQVWRSLKTKQYDVARTESRKILLTIEQLFQRIRNDMDSRLINGMVAEYGLEAIGNMDKERYRRTEGRAYKQVEVESQHWLDSSERRRIEEVTGAHLKDEGTLELAIWYLKEFKNRGLLDGQDFSKDDIKQVVTSLHTAERQLFKVEAERLLGTTSEESDFQHRLLEKWNKDKIVKKDVGIPLSDLLTEYGAQWKNDNISRVRRKVTELKRLTKSFRDCFKRDVGVKEIDEELIQQWYQFLVDDNGNSYHTIDNNRKTMSAVFNDKHTKKMKYVDRNPFSEGLPFDREGLANEQSRVFTNNELQQYVDLLADYYNPDALEMTWLPIIMMYSGMRPNEVAQLYIDDIQTTPEGSPFFRIIKNVERKQWVKSNATRAVPIHEKLIELGLTDYVERMKLAGESQLFPNCKLQKNTNYYYSDAMSTGINAIINLHIDSDKKLRLYSLRKNFRSALDNLLTERIIASIEGTGSAEVIPLLKWFERGVNDIMGHAMNGTTGDNVYRVLASRVKAAVLGVMNHPVDLSRLKGCLFNP